jgi:hypothetical protein
VLQDEEEIRSCRVLIDGLQAPRHREGMGKPEFPPQGVGTPVFLWVKTDEIVPAKGLARGGRL